MKSKKNLIKFVSSRPNVTQKDEHHHGANPQAHANNELKLYLHLGNSSEKLMQIIIMIINLQNINYLSNAKLLESKIIHA